MAKKKKGKSGKENKNKKQKESKKKTSKKDQKTDNKIADRVKKRNIVEEMKDSYLDYAMSVIVARALPDVRDGLKPGQRRILYAMNKMGLTAGAKFRKSAAVVGEVLGKYHPHGDTAVYDTMVKMAQDFTYRYPLVTGQGNFGSIDGDPAAAMRYTEARMEKISAEMLRDIEKETVEWRDNYDQTTQEPIVFPAAVPNLLLNGTLGIAVGMASNIPPHHLGEVIDATIALIDNSEATVDDLMEHVQGPDFPTGAIAFDQKDIKHAYANGRGGVVVRGHAEIVEDKKGNYTIVISSLPYRTNKADLIVKIADLVKDKKIDGIRDLRDESTSDVRIVIELKTTAHPQKVLNHLYKKTQIEDTFHYNMVGLVDGVPQTLSLKTILEEFIKHRQEVVRRRSEYDLKKAEDREHILLGLKKALDHIDEIIKVIKSSEDRDEAHKNLKKKFKFSDKQTTAILEMRLQRLAGLERKKIEDELEEVQKTINYLKDLLASKKKMLSVIKEELEEIKEKYGDERRTKIIKGGVKNINEEDLIPNEESVLVLTHGGYIKRTDPKAYKRQKRGGVGVIDLNTKEEDFISNFLTTTTHSDLLFFSDKGKVYQIKMYELPEGKRATKGKSIVNYIDLSPDEKITSVLPMPKKVREGDTSLIMVTKNGVAKRVEAKNFHDVRRGGIIAINLKDDDELISAKFIDDKEEAVVVTSEGKAIRFKAKDVRVMGRTATGVKAIKLKKGDFVVGSSVIKQEYNKPELLVLTENGYGKKTPLKQYKTQKRGGSGLKTANVTKKTGKVIASRVIGGDQEEIIAMSKKGQVIRTELNEIPVQGRSTQGVRVMKLREEDSVASVVVL